MSAFGPKLREKNTAEMAEKPWNLNRLGRQRIGDRLAWPDIGIGAINFRPLRRQGESRLLARPVQE